MLTVKRVISIKAIESVNVSLEFLKDIECCKLLTNLLLKLTKKQFCWGDINTDVLVKKKTKFGDNNKINSFILVVKHEEDSICIGISEVVYVYYVN